MRSVRDSPSTSGTCTCSAQAWNASSRFLAASRLGGCVDLAEEFFGYPGAGHLVVAVTVGMGQGGGDAMAGGVAEPFLGDQQEAADVVERIALAAPMSRHVLVCTLTDFGDDLVRKADQVQSRTSAVSDRSLAGAWGFGYGGGR